MCKFTDMKLRNLNLNNTEIEHSSGFNFFNATQDNYQYYFGLNLPMRFKYQFDVKVYCSNTTTQLSFNISKFL